MFKQALRESTGFAVGLSTFLAVLFLADWVVHGVSMAIFKLDPSAVPESFFLAYEAPEPDHRGIKYDAITWRQYGSETGKSGIRTLLLPEPSGRIQSKGDSLSFRVLEDDGARQLIEVKYNGAYRSWSRYEAYRDRAVPIAYRAYGWGDPVGSHAAIWLCALLLAGICAAAAVSGVKRLLRLQRT